MGKRRIFDVQLEKYALYVTPQQVSRDPLRGQLFENMVVSDIHKQMLNQGRDARLSFLRTEKGFEVDLIISRGGDIQPIEIKSAMTYHNSFTNNLHKLMKVEKNIKSPCLLYDGDLNIPMEDEEINIGVCNFREFGVGI